MLNARLPKLKLTSKISLFAELGYTGSGITDGAGVESMKLQNLETFKKRLL